MGLRKFERELPHQVPNDGPSHFVTSLDTDAVLSIDPADCRNASTIRFLFDGTSSREVERVMASGMDRRVILEALASQGIPDAVASDLPPLPEAASALLLYGSRARGDATSNAPLTGATG